MNIDNNYYNNNNRIIKTPQIESDNNKMIRWFKFREFSN